jgi:hypothetical protein
MISRIMTAAVLSAGMAVLFSPAFAQTATGGTGMTSGPITGATTGGSLGNNPGSVGPVERSSMKNNAGMQATGQANMQPGVNQAQTGRKKMGARGTDAMERQVTECLNNAASNRTAMDACRR